jgi:hypothetical protein
MTIATELILWSLKLMVSHPQIDIIDNHWTLRFFHGEVVA